jgi:hypothetical protein
VVRDRDGEGAPPAPGTVIALHPPGARLHSDRYAVNGYTLPQWEREHRHKKRRPATVDEGMHAVKQGGRCDVGIPNDQRAGGLAQGKRERPPDPLVRDAARPEQVRQMHPGGKGGRGMEAGMRIEQQHRALAGDGGEEMVEEKRGAAAIAANQRVRAAKRETADDDIERWDAGGKEAMVDLFGMARGGQVRGDRAQPRVDGLRCREFRHATYLRLVPPPPSPRGSTAQL